MKQETAEVACQTNSQAAQQMPNGKDLCEYHSDHGSDTKVEHHQIVVSSEISAEAEIGVSEGSGRCTQLKIDTQKSAFDLHNSFGDSDVVYSSSGDNAGKCQDDFLDNMFGTNGFVNQVRVCSIFLVLRELPFDME